jgi:hypothetical protein
MGANDLTPTIVQTPNHPAYSESLHQLHCPGPKTAVSYDDNINLKSKHSGFQNVYFNFMQSFFHSNPYDTPGKTL